MSKKVQTLTNAFNALKSDSDDVPVEEEEEIVEVKEDPSTTLGKFQTLCKNVKTLADLGSAMNKFIGPIKSSRTYDYKFDAYDNLTPNDYLEILKARTTCFNDRVSPEILNEAYKIYTRLPEKDIKQLLKGVFKSLKGKKPTGHGALLLISHILCEEPDLFTKDLVELDINEIPDASHALGFLFAYVIENSTKPPKGDFVLTIFSKVFLSADVAYGPMAVCAAHCSMNALRKYRDPEISAFHYALIDRLVSDHSTNRAKHISIVFEKFSKVMRIRNIERLAGALITLNEDRPNYLQQQLVRFANNDPDFVDGWVHYNEKHLDGIAALQAVTDRLKFKVVQKFPQETLAGDSDNVRLTNMRKDLHRRSIHGLILAAIAGAAFCSHYYLHLF